MENIAAGFRSAFQLLLSFDKEVYGIILLSLYVSIVATMLATLAGVPIGIFLGVKNFIGKRLVVRIIYTMMSMPPVIVGLFVFLFISRRGPLGFLGIVYTPMAMIVAQFILITPIITGVVYNATKGKGKEIIMVGKTLGANRFQRLLLLISELRSNIFSSIITGYGRGVSEVGAVMIVGGNIRGHTRVMTTTIAMMQSMGNYDMAIALGLVLLMISFVINSTLNYFQKGD